MNSFFVKKKTSSGSCSYQVINHFHYHDFYKSYDNNYNRNQKNYNQKNCNQGNYNQNWSQQILHAKYSHDH